MADLIALHRPEAGGIRSQHLICKYNISILVQSEFQLGIRDNDAPGERVIRASVIQGKGLVPQGLCVLRAVARELFLKNLHRALIGDILVVIADLSLGGRSVDRFGKFLRFLKSFRKPDPAYSSGLLVGSPAAAGDITTDDAFERKHGELLHLHGLAGELLRAEVFGHIRRVHGDHVVRDQILGEIEPECGHPGEDGTLVGDLIFQDMIKGGDPVCRHHDQAVADIIYFSYFAGFVGLEFLHNVHPFRC